MLLVVFEQRLGSWALDQLRVIVRYLDELEGFFDGRIILQNIEDKALLNGLPHGINVEGTVNNRSIRALLMNAKQLQGFALRCRGKGKEGLVLVPALTNHSVDILVCQIYIRFVDTLFLSVVLNSYANINQATA